MGSIPAGSQVSWEVERSGTSSLEGGTNHSLEEWEKLRKRGETLAVPLDPKVMCQRLAVPTSIWLPPLERGLSPNGILLCCLSRSVIEML